MKKLLQLAVLLVLLTMLPQLALADNPIIVYTSDCATYVTSTGIYATLNDPDSRLYSGPGDFYHTLTYPYRGSVTVRCLTIAVDENHTPWVLVDINDNGTRMRGYVLLDKFSPQESYRITDVLPFEGSYDTLTPYMIAMPYYADQGYWGPGPAYAESDVLDATAQGTIILIDGEWALLDLPEFNFPGIPWRFRQRLWVQLDNLMY